MAYDNNDASSSRRPTRRGVGFPQMPLPEAAKVITEVSRYGKEHSLDAMAGYLGHDTTNSGPFRQKLAAFRDWKLISKSGDAVSLTNLAQRIAYPTHENEREDALVAAFNNAAIFKDVFEKCAKGVDLDTQRIGNIAVQTLGVAARLRDKFVSSFVESAVGAGLAEKVGDQQVKLLAEPTAAEQKVLSASQAQPADTTPNGIATNIGTAHRKSTAGSPVVSQVWPIDGGEVVFEVRSSSPLGAEVFGKVAQVVSAAQELADLLKGQTDNGDASS